MKHKLLLHKFAFVHSYLIFSRPNLSKIFKYKCLKRDMATDTKYLSESKSHLKDIFYSAVKAVSPSEIIKKRVKFQDHVLYIDEKSFPLQDNVYLVGFGKAVMGMAVEVEKILGSALKKGIISIPSMSKDAIWTLEDKSSFPKLYNSVIEYREGSINNHPDNRSLNTTHDIINLVEKLTEMDTLIVLVSGGGSSLLYMPRPVLDHEDKLELCKKLQDAGADITELNIVRRKLSLVKGGGLARMAYPTSVITLILSDIIGDPIDLIASGPTVYSGKAPEDVIAILKKYNLYQSLEGDLKTLVTSKEAFYDGLQLTPDKQFKHVTNIIIGNNTMALKAARFEALRKNFNSVILGNDVKGNVKNVSLAYADITSLICLVLSNELKKEEFYNKVRVNPILSLSTDKIDEIFCGITEMSHRNHVDGIILIGGGEPTVVVTGKGRGGRNQELALHFSLDWLAKIKSYPQLTKYDVTILSAGSDGQDGPTDAAGAFGYPAIAPIMHDIYAKVKSMTTEEAISILSQQETKVIDKKSFVQDSSKQQKLKESIIKSKITLQKQNSSNIPEKSISAQKDINEHIDISTLMTLEVERMLPENALKENDTYNFYSRFKKGSDLVKTGFTGTNVMDLHFIYIRKRSQTCKCDIDFSNQLKCEDSLNIHDLHIDATTVEKYKDTNVTLKCKDKFLQDSISEAETKKPPLNIKIIDENSINSCCNKKT